MIYSKQHLIDILDKFKVGESIIIIDNLGRKIKIIFFRIRWYQFKRKENILLCVENIKDGLSVFIDFSYRIEEPKFSIFIKMILSKFSDRRSHGRKN